MPKVAMQSVGSRWKVVALIHELEFASVDISWSCCDGSEDYFPIVGCK